MGKLVVLNAPFGFAYIWSTVVQMWLSKETVEKVVICGSDYKEKLLEFIDAENLPAIYGGTCTCEGMGGCLVSSAGPWKQSITHDAEETIPLQNEQPNGTVEAA